MSGFFESLEIDDSLRKEANTKAIKLANMRVRNAYYDFLAQAPSRQERKARFALIKDDLNEVVANACHEAGHEDVDSIRKSVIYSLMSGLDKAAEVDLDRLSMGNSEEQPQQPGQSDAYNAGYGHGQGNGSWMIDGNTDPRDAQRILQGYEDGDPEIMDMEPHPLSGEMAGESIPELSDQHGIDLHDPNNADDFEAGHSDGFWDQVQNDARGIMPDPEDPGQYPPGHAPHRGNRRQGSRRPLGKEAGPKELLTYPKRYYDYMQERRNPPVGFDAYDPNRVAPQAVQKDEFSPVEYRYPDEEEQQAPQRQVARTARRPQMCPFHKEVTDISLTSGDPRAGFQDMKDHWGGPQHCQSGDYSGPKCNFTREMTTQQFWDDREQKLEEQRNEREQERELQDSVTDRFEQPSESPENTGIIDDSAPAIDDSDLDMGGDHSDISESLSEAPSAVGAGEAVVSAYSDDRGQQKPGERAVFKPGEDDAGAAYREEEDQNRSVTCPNCGSMVPAGKESCTQCGYQRGEKVDKDSRRRSARRRIRSSIHQALKDGDSVVEDQDVDRSVGPVPEMDQTKWKPTALSEDGGNLHPINTDSGTAHPSEFQDKFTKPDWGADRYDKARAVTTTEPATTDTSVSPEQMTSWENNGTNAVSDTRDNPLVISSTLPSDQHIQAAIREFESRK